MSGPAVENRPVGRGTGQRRSITLSARPAISSILVWHLILALLVFAAASFGIWTRSAGLLASFWPANALLLGFLVQKPKLARPPGWIIAFGAYIAADLAAGDPLSLTLRLSGANLAGVAVGYVLLRKLPEADRKLIRMRSVLYLFAILLAASAAAAIVGASASTASLNRSALVGVAYWFATELVNYIVVLPVLLAERRIGGSLYPWRRKGDFRHLLATLAPIAGLIATMIAGMAVGGPGAPAFVVPAVLWCALNYGVSTVAAITLMTFIWSMVCVALGVMDLAFGDDPVHTIVSLRLGAALLTLGPLTVASVNAARNDALARLDYTANHDMLTGVLLRRTLLRRAERKLAASARRRHGFAVMAIDIDKLARINETHGHAAGDDVLAQVAGRISGCVRRDDLVGRISGQQFAIVADCLTPADAMALSERLRRTIAQADIMADNASIALTASFGIVHVEADPSHSARELVGAAAALIPKAKAAGGDTIATEG